MEMRCWPPSAHFRFLCQPGRLEYQTSLMQSSNVFIVDADATVRSSLSRDLGLAGYSVTGFVDAESLLSLLRPGLRGCVITELQLPGMDGLALQKKLDEQRVAVPVIFVSEKIDVPAVVKAMKQGAIDFLMKPVDPRAVFVAVELALQKGAENADARFAVEQAEMRWASLSIREKEVCKLAGRGMLLKEIAAEFGTTEPTVHLQRASAFQKLGVNSILELIRVLDRIHHEP